jgi:hypothetical protein
VKHEPHLQSAQPSDTHSIHWDIESRSKINLTEAGAAKYAADPSTEVILMSYAVDDAPPRLWFPG